jgi:8-oxo-dGTP diphosphatase
MDFQNRVPAIQVACAMIVVDRKVLAVKRGSTMKMPGKWEFPGGKLEHGESASECIVREIREELCMEITILQEMDSVLHDYGDFVIRLIPFICSTTQLEPKLNEHESHLWVDPNSILDLDWAAADIPLAERMQIRLLNH